MPRILAVDWFGARRSERRALWLAEARDGRLVRLECGRSREELVEHLLAEAAGEPELVVGLDFACSFPGWFLNTYGIRTAYNAWDLVAREAEGWLSDPKPPFWRTRRPPGDGGFRRTELECVFQLAGAGQVGTGSLRGIPFLPRLRERARARRGRVGGRDEPLERRLAAASTRAGIRARGPDLARGSRPRRRLDSLT